MTSHGCDTGLDARGMAIKPRRLNFALVCIWCGERGCHSRHCVELHSRSRWMVCEECLGFGFAGDCDCTFGVVEAVSENTVRARLRGAYGHAGEYLGDRDARHSA